MLRKDTPYTLLETELEGACDLILKEVMQGFRTHDDRAGAETGFSRRRSL